MSEAPVLDAPVVDPALTPAPAASGAPDPAPNADPAGESSAEDWRAPFAMGEDGKVDDKRLKDLQKFTTQADFDKAFRDTQTALRNKQEGTIKLLGPDATDEDKAAFNKSLGIPDKVDGYKDLIAPPEGLELSEVDQQFIEGMTAKLHEQGGFLATAEGQNQARQFYYDMYEEQASQMAAKAMLTKQETEKNLKSDWGSEYKINLAYAEEALKANLPQGTTVEDVLGTTTSEGVPLASTEWFMRLLTNAGRNSTEDLSFLQSLQGSADMSAQSVEDEVSGIMKKMNGTPQEQEEYNKLSQPGGRLQTLLARRERLSGQ